MIVDGFNALLRVLVSGYAGLFGTLNPLLGLALASVAIGIGMLWVVGKTSNQPAIARAKKRMQAHLLEMKLYQDEPRLLFRAQGHLLLNNFRYVGHMLRPALFLALPMVVLYAHFDSVYGRRALRPGEFVLLSATTDLSSDDLELTGAGSIEVDSVSVATATGEVVWRIRAKADGTGELALRSPQGTVSKSALASDSLAYVSLARTNSWWQRLLLTPGEGRYPSTGVSTVRISYPAREIGVGGWETHWVIWFLGVSILSAYLLKGFFGIAL